MTTSRVSIRRVVLEDIPALVDIHAGSEGPYTVTVQCAIHLNHRLRRPFLCYVAEDDGKVIGHAEWIVGAEPDITGSQLYLGMLQIREDYRGRGVGRHLVEHGASLGLRYGCRVLRTIPEKDVEAFYRKCGMSPVFELASFSYPVGNELLPSGWARSKGVPRRAIGALPMRLGWVQGCSMHMWEISNRPVRLYGERNFRHPCVVRQDGKAYVQLRFRARSQGLVLAWSEIGTPIGELIQVACALAATHAVTGLLIAVLVSDMAQVPAGAMLSDRNWVWSRTLTESVSSI